MAQTSGLMQEMRQQMQAAAQAAPEHSQSLPAAAPAEPPPGPAQSTGTGKLPQIVSILRSFGMHDSSSNFSPMVTSML